MKMNERRTFTYFHSADWPRRFPPLLAAALVVASPTAGREGICNDLELLDADDIRAADAADAVRSRFAASALCRIASRFPKK
jgi:hypothetical protein